MTVQAIEGVVSQLNVVATQATNPTKPIIEPVGFADHLVASVNYSWL